MTTLRKEKTGKTQSKNLMIVHHMVDSSSVFLLFLLSVLMNSCMDNITIVTLNINGGRDG